MRMRLGAKLDVVLALREDGTPSVRKLLSVVPFTSVSNRWGEEIYFTAPFHSELEADARAIMQVGDAAYWPDGDAIALFFGRTPASTDDRPRAYGPCNIIGKVEGDPFRLTRVASGSAVVVRAF